MRYDVRQQVRFYGYFNPRTCTRCDQSTNVNFTSSTISIHAPARGAMVRVHSKSSTSTHFNPRTCTRCDEQCGFKPSSVFISIHAPARGAIPIRHPRNPRQTISIHAPARGAIGVGETLPSRTSFQSTHLHEVRCLVSSVSTSRSDISIHAPARGAIAALASMVAWVQISIHAPARGAIKALFHPPPSQDEFQSTHLHEVR